MRDKGIKVIGKYDGVYASLISQKLGAKLIQIDGLDKVDNVIGDIVNSTISFSYNEIQILLILLGIFIVLAL